MSELQTFLPLLNTLFFLGIFLLGIRYGNVVDPKHQSVLGQHVDNILFGGLLATGNVMAACFALPTLLYMFARIRQQDRQWILASGYANLIQIVFAAWFADWSTGWPTLLGLTKVAAIFALAYVMSDIAKNTTFHLYQSTSIDLTMGWLCYTNLFVFLPALVVATSTPWLSLTTLVIATAFFVWLHEINVQEVMLESARITGEGSSAVGTEQISIGYIVLGGSGIHPHIFSILFAYLTYQIVNLLWVVPTQWLVMGSTVGIYLLIFIIWTTAILNRRLSPHLWQAKLNQDRQRLSNITKETQLKDVLHSVKQRLYWRELGANVLVIVIMLMVFYGDTMSGTSFPLALLLTFAVILLASSGRSFLAQLYDFMISRTPHHTQEIDLSKLPDLDEELSLYQRIKRFFDSNIGQTLAIIFVICQIILFFHDGIRVLFDLVTSIMP